MHDFHIYTFEVTLGLSEPFNIAVVAFQTSTAWITAAERISRMSPSATNLMLKSVADCSPELQAELQKIPNAR